MLLLVFSDVARKLFVERQRDGKRLALADWPWPGMSSAEIKEILQARDRHWPTSVGSCGYQVSDKSE